MAGRLPTTAAFLMKLENRLYHCKSARHALWAAEFGRKNVLQATSPVFTELSTRLKCDAAAVSHSCTSCAEKALPCAACRMTGLLHSFGRLEKLGH